LLNGRESFNQSTFLSASLKREDGIKASHTQFWHWKLKFSNRFRNRNHWLCWHWKEWSDPCFDQNTLNEKPTVSQIIWILEDALIVSLKKSFRSINRFSFSREFISIWWIIWPRLFHSKNQNFNPNRLSFITYTFLPDKTSEKESTQTFFIVISHFSEDFPSVSQSRSFSSEISWNPNLPSSLWSLWASGYGNEGTNLIFVFKRCDIHLEIKDVLFCRLCQESIMRNSNFSRCSCENLFVWNNKVSFVNCCLHHCDDWQMNWN
jgi:hypothetical protein